MKQIILFDQKQIRRLWDENQEKWFFSVIDVISALTDTTIPTRYWSDLKRKLIEEGSQLYDKIVQLKMIASDGKKYFTDCADTQNIFRIIQSIPSPKAEPFKLWLAKVGYERLKEINDPEISLNRARDNWKSMGHSKEWTGLTVKEHKNLKNLKGHNLRDNMTDAELLFTSLAELTTNKIAENKKSIGFNKNAVSAKKGGAYAKKTKDNFEKITNSKVISKKNYLPPVKIKQIK